MNHSPAINRRRNALAKERRGVLLLMILSLLVLFVLIGMTFILSASQFKRAASMRAVAGVNGDSPQQLSETAIHQLLRDTSGPGSAAHTHGLLRDLYGTDGLRGAIDTVPEVFLQGQMIRITDANPTQLVLSGFDTNTNGIDDLIDVAITGGVDGNTNGIDDAKEIKGTGFYNGGVLTFTSGAANGLSAFILEYRRDPATGLVSIDVETDGELAAMIAGGSQLLAPNDQYVINGRPFNGSGAGFNRATGNVDAALSLGGFDFVSLLPNHSLLGNTAIATSGGMDEPYDIADYQNMALAWVPANRDRQAAGQIIPSFHRPALINYWLSNSGTGGTVYPSAASLRPVRDMRNHPFFGNPNFNPVLGPWDVDNDGNGAADSVWIDMGVPVQLNAQGRLVKPMFAILCVDADGRVNINTAGTLAQSTDDATAEARGDGYGPAEIRLSRVTSTPNLIIQSRYMGEGETPTTAAPGLPGINDDWSNAAGLTFPFKSYLAATSYSPENVTNYLNPIDPAGRSSFKIDPFGQPLINGFAVLGTANAYVDDPYETNILSPNSSDNLFGAADMEILLRRFDSDVLDVSRRLVDSGINILDLGLVTTASFENSAPQFQLPADLRLNGGTQGGFLDIVNTRLRGDTTAASYWPQIQTMFPYELLQGQKMNLNRPIGFAEDNNNNGVVDEPFELFASTNNNDLLNDRGAFADPKAVTAPIRQLFARNLFCLARMLVDKTAQLDYDGDGVGSIVETNFALAQWAVNVIDFRDGDSIMTPFEFDTNLFNGWNVDGDLSTTNDPDRGVVWGCERPELLITETLAWHDRRTEDTDQDATGNNTAGGDTHFDQRLRPFGSFFVELYNPWTSTIERKPRELYIQDPATGAQAINLGRMSGRGSPVWRLMVSDQFFNPQDAATSAPSYNNPDHVTYTDQGQRDRFVYFVDDISLLPPTDDAFRVATGARAGLVRNGGHAVIGSSGHVDTITQRNVSVCSALIGGEPNDNIAATRRIELVREQQAFSPLREPNDVEAPTVPFGTVIVESLSISEGLRGTYATFDGTTVEDIPLDMDQDAPLNGFDNGMHVAFRIVHLQRLADPTVRYNALTNPYRTIDSSFVDLNVFNSMSTQADDALAGGITGDESFHASQRGDGWNVVDGGWHQLYRMQPRGLSSHQGQEPVQVHTYDRTLKTTLGQPNTEYAALGGGANYFPHLSWNNRPYISEYELLNVPRTSSFHLPRMFGGTETFDIERPANPKLNFPHLFDLRSEARLQQGGGVGLERVLEYVDVPSRYLGTEKWYSEDVFATANRNTSENIAAATRRLGAHSMSRFREPGKVNLNSITDPRVWAAVAGGAPNMYHGLAENAFWSQLVEKSIRVPTFNIGTPTSHLNPAFPTQFPRPFRPSSASDLGPLPDMREPTDPTTGTNRGFSGLLREHPDPTNDLPLFYARVDGDPSQDALRSSYFYNRGIQRLANLTSFQSNVYTVWVTVGYFEVEPWRTTDGVTYDPSGPVVADAAHPDGYMLTSEAGADTGQVERHRSFYVIDRSIPVAFEPGKNHNVDKTILLRRHLD